MMRSVVKRYIKSKKGFSLTELIIIVAVIGILAAAIIPAFVGVDDRAISEADENTVAVLNTQLQSADALKKDLSTLEKVRTHLHKAGYSDAALRPEYVGDTADEKYCFVWDKSLNAILMIDLRNDDIIYPEEYRYKNGAEDNVINDGDWYFVEKDPTPEDDCRYPSVLHVARDYYDALLSSETFTEADPTKDSVYAVTLKVSFMYDGVNFEREPVVAWAQHMKNGEYEGGVHGSKLGPINISKKLVFAQHKDAEDAKALLIKATNLEGNESTVEGLYLNDPQRVNPAVIPEEEASLPTGMSIIGEVFIFDNADGFVSTGEVVPAYLTIGG